MLSYFSGTRSNDVGDDKLCHNTHETSEMWYRYTNVLHLESGVCYLTFFISSTLLIVRLDIVGGLTVNSPQYPAKFFSFLRVAGHEVESADTFEIAESFMIKYANSQCPEILQFVYGWHTALA